MDENKGLKRRRQHTESYDQKLEQRVAKHECLRDRNNVTTCRSSGLKQEGDWKSEMRRKRHKEFLKRRHINQDVVSAVPDEKPNQEVKVKLRANRRNVPPINRQSLVMAQDLGITWPDIHTLDQVPWISPSSTPDRGQLMRTEPKSRARDSLSLTLNYTDGPVRRDVGKEDGRMKSRQLSLRDSSAQTEPGYVTVRETELLQLADYLKEALRREETLKKKLSLLQQSTATLLLSSDKIWKTCTKEDLMKNKIVSLESQLQICIQKISKDGAKRLLLQLEEQKQAADERSLATIQRLTTEKSELQEKVETLERALQSAREEGDRWKGLYKEQKMNCLQLQTSLEQSIDKLQILQSQLQRTQGQEAALQEQLLQLQQDYAQLQHQAFLMEQDHRRGRENLHEFRGSIPEEWALSREGFIMSDWVESGEKLQTHVRAISTNQASSGDTEQCKYTSGKQKWLEIDTESTKAETNKPKLSSTDADYHHQQSPPVKENNRHETKNRRRRCSSCFCWCVLLLALLTAAVAFVFIHQPVTRYQLQALYRTLETHTQQYLLDVASPEHSKCFRPI